ncbi:iron chaperone [Algoriphagus namhaensis]
MSNVVSQYLGELPKKEQEALETVRKQILSLIPEAEERLSRGVPFFYYKGKRAVGFRSSKTHLSFFIMEGKVLDTHRSEISNYDNSSTIIKFSLDKPLSKHIIEKLVRARIEEIEKSLLKKTK